MKVNTALCFLLTGCGLVLQAAEESRPWRTYFSRFCAAAATAIAALTLAQDLYGTDIGIDQWFHTEYPSAGSSGAPGRMSPISAVSFLLGAAALICASLKRPQLRAASQLPALAAGLITLTVIIGYAYDAVSLYTIVPYTSIALHTALLLQVLVAGILALHPELIVVRTLTSRFAGGRLLRGTLPPVILLPFALGGIYLRTGAGVPMNAHFGLAALVAANMAIMAALMFRNAVNLNRADEEIRLGEAKLVEALASSQDAQLVVHSSGRVTLANTQAAALAGRRQGELLGQSVAELLPAQPGPRPRHPILQFFAEASPRARTTGVELDVARRDGTRLPVELSLTPLHSPDEVLVTISIPRFIPDGQIPPVSGPREVREVRVLLVEPDADEAARLKAAMRSDDGPVAEVMIAVSAEDAQALMRELPFDLLFLDLGLPARGGLAALKRIKQQYPAMPVIALAWDYDGPLARQAMAEGAEDCVAKSLIGPLSLARIVCRALEHNASMETMRDMERQFRLLLDASPSVIYLTKIESTQHHCRLVSRALVEIAGYDPGDMTADPDFWVSRVHPDDRTRVLDEFAAAMGRGTGVLEYRFRTASGDYRWIEDRFRLVLGLHEERLAVGSWTDLTDRHLAMAAMRRSESMFRQIFDSTPDGLMLVAADGTIVKGNALADGIFAVPAGSLVGRKIESLIPVRFRDTHVRLRATYLARPAPRRMGAKRHLLALRGDGTEFPIDASLNPIEIDGDALVMCAVRDISEQLQIQSEHERYGRMLDESVNEIYIFDADTLRFVGVNTGACRNLGYSREELSGLTPLDIKPEFLRPQFERLIAPLRGREGQLVTFQTTHRRKDGSTYPVEVHLQYFADPAHPVFVAFILDITGRRAAEDRLRASERQLTTTFANLPGAVYRCSNDANWTMSAVSPGMQVLTGFAPNQFLSGEITYAGIIHPDDRAAIWAAVQDALRCRMSYEFEYRIIAADGHEKWVREHGCGIFAGDGELEALEGFIWDISERKEQEQGLSRLNRMYVFLKETHGATSRIHERQALLWEICRVAVEHGELTVAWIAYREQGAPEMVPVAHYGEGSERLVRNRHPVDSEDLTDPCLVERAIRDREVAVCNDLATMPDHHAETSTALGLGLRSGAAIPLLVTGQCVGVFVLYSTAPDFFAQEELRLLRELARDLAFALDYIGKAQRARFLTNYDALTGLRNRSMFLQDVSRSVREQSREQRLCVLVFDIERFTQINDSLGRHVGDQLLQQVAQRVKDAKREGQSAARLGEDQFAIVIPGVQHEQDAARYVEGLIGALFGQPFHLDGTELRVSARFGVAMFPDDGDTADVLFRHAEAALRKARLSGDRYLFFTRKMTERAAEKLSLENELRRALEQDEFVLHYQPIVDAANLRLQSVEALIRWNHPQRGLVPPMQFIPLLEETGLILDVGEWALASAAADLRAWHAQGLPPPRVAVNVSPIQFRKSNFVSEALAAMCRGGTHMPLDLEITESAVMENVQEHLQKLLELRAAGCNIIVDDFGTGYSSLSYLTRLPISTLKIDRSFIIGMTGALQNRLIVSTIISLAHNLNLKVVAEGVDADEQVEILRQLRCDSIQGFLISKPVPPEQLVAQFRNGELRPG